MPKRRSGTSKISKRRKTNISFKSFGSLRNLDSDDSSDSDYSPGISEGYGESKKSTLNNKQGRKTSKACNGQRARSRRLCEQQDIDSEAGEISPNQETSIHSLPAEIWVQIFQEVFKKEENHLFFYNRARRVCKQWRDIVELQECLPRTVSLVGTCIKDRKDKTLIQHCPNFLRKCISLDLTGWTTLSVAGLKAVADSLEDLEEIILTKCVTLQVSDVLNLFRQCQKLKSLTIADMRKPLNMKNARLQQAKMLCSPASLDAVLTTIGARLQYLDVSRAPEIKKAFFTSLASSCPNLVYLDFSRPDIIYDGSLSPVVTMMRACTKLTTLKCNNVFFAHNMPPNSGVEPNRDDDGSRLRVLEVESHLPEMESFSMRPAAVKSLVHFVDPEEVEVLDISFCSRASDVLLNLKTRRLLNLRCRFATFGENEFKPDLFHAFWNWKNSLQSLDISHVRDLSSTFIENLLASLSVMSFEIVVKDSSNTTLLELNLSATNVEFQSLRRYFGNFVALKWVDLTACRSLPRAIKKLYENSEEVKSLQLNIKEIMLSQD